MVREICTIIIIIFLILLGNHITEEYTVYATDTMIGLLEEIDKENKPNNEKISEVNEKWDEIKNKMAYYIEHNELEKVENYLKAIESSIKAEELEDSKVYINQCKFMLKHISEKYEFNLQNIF